MSTNYQTPVSGHWARRMNRWLDEEGPFHLQKEDGSPSCGATYRSMTGPYPTQPTRGQCCRRCLATYDKQNDPR